MSTPERRLLLLPRLGGDQKSDFYPWLIGQLSAEAEVTVLPAADPAAPSVSAWPARIAAAIGSDPRVSQRTYLLGHSVGALAALHAVARLPWGCRAGGALLVAGFFTLPRPDPILQPWVDTPLDLSAVRDGAQRLVSLVSTDDPFSPEAAGRRQIWVERLGASVRVEPGARHFGRPWEPAVLDAARALLRA